jgi:MFS superfamily sulfate permease-like transporter
LSKSVILAVKSVHLHKLYVPAWRWLRAYNLKDLPWDVNAGIIMGVLLIPQVLGLLV